jgi:hypothetical protein
MSRFGSSMGSLIKSIQQGVITITSGQASNTATISAVNTLKTAVWVNGWKSAYDVGGVSPTIALTNSTTVTATVAGSGAYSKDVGYLVLEFY